VEGNNISVKDKTMYCFLNRACLLYQFPLNFHLVYQDGYVKDSAANQLLLHLIYNLHLPPLNTLYNGYFKLCVHLYLYYCYFLRL